MSTIIAITFIDSIAIMFDSDSFIDDIV